jgi:sterol desaturase/sphingolipid hydroxylase (fatty acid hydroxylase superfamily)
MKGNLIGAFVVLFFVFVPVERLFALRREQKIFREGWLTDLTHFFVSHVLAQAGLFVAIGVLAVGLHGIVGGRFQAAVAAQPHWLQFVEAIVLADFAGYFAHRLTHRVPWLWKLHAVHHSSQQMDWLASARLHPLDQVFTRAMTILPLFMMGFTRETLGIYVVFAAFWALFIHANVRLRFPGLRWVLATPEYHHWHHSADPEARDKNFAGQTPLVDVLFGTCYLPKDRWPAGYGVEDPVPARYLPQLVFPFRRDSHALQASPVRPAR